MKLITEVILVREVEALRVLLGMTIPDYSELMGLSSRKYSNLIARGKAAPLLALVKLCRVLDFPMAMFADSIPTKILKRRQEGPPARRARRRDVRPSN